MQHHAPLPGLLDKVRYQVRGPVDPHRNVVPRGPAHAIRDLLRVLRQLPEALVDTEETAEFGEPPIKLHSGNVDHPSLLKLLARTRSGDRDRCNLFLVVARARLGIDQAFEAGRNAQPPPLVVEPRLPRCYQSAAGLDELADRFELCVAETFRFGQHEHLVLREVRQRCV